jgi:phage baseplate assembly protein W
MATYDAQDWAATWEAAAGGFAPGAQQWDFPPDALPVVVVPPPVLVATPAPPAPPVVDTYGLGVDLDCLTDITPGLALAAGTDNLMKALARRLITPRGGLFYDPDYGLDLREYLHAGVTAAQIATLSGSVEAEVEKDPRVQSADASVSFVGATMMVRVVVNPIAGPHRLIVLAVTSENVATLTAEAA